MVYAVYKALYVRTYKNDYMNRSQSGIVVVVREERKMLNVRKETWERLQSFGKFRESTDDLLNRLMDNMTKVSKK
jgi:hypothetical protein